jgi:hypothetical protein
MTVDAPNQLIGYDSTTPAEIPATAEVVFPYADGEFRWTAAETARFRRARRRHYTVEGNADLAAIADIERFDMKPKDAPGFADRWAEAHPRSRWPACFYVNRSNLAELQHYMKGRIYLVGLATLDGTIPHQISGGGRLVYVQFETTAKYDRSEVLVPEWLLYPHGFGDKHGL